METAITESIKTIPAMIRNTHFNITLSEWPAAITIISVCGTVLIGFIVNTVATTSTNQSQAKVA